MTDIVERLREWPCPTGTDIERVLTEAADEIERLRKALDKYACHKIECARIKDAVAKCDCGLQEEIERLRQRIATERDGSDTWDQAQDSEVRRLRAEVELWKERYNDLLRDADNGYSL